MRLPSRPLRSIASVVDNIAAMRDEGLDLAIIYLPPPHTPAVLEPVAEAISTLAC